MDSRVSFLGLKARSRTAATSVEVVVPSNSPRWWLEKKRGGYDDGDEEVGRCGGEKVKRSILGERRLKSRKEEASAQLKPYDHGLLGVARSRSRRTKNSALSFLNDFERDGIWTRGSVGDCQFPGRLVLVAQGERGEGAAAAVGSQSERGKVKRVSGRVYSDR